ncbi:MAG: BLUF domain-containing protein [Acidocella sp.]|nr:BLUF domain-containing protein [Acidocella sp.]
MAQAQTQAETTPLDYSPSFSLKANNDSLATIVYRSRATSSLSYEALETLSKTAQLRNHAESITGVMLYDESCFFQWLEGPPENLSRVMESIRRDQRHEDVEILSERPITARMFGGWDMKLATRSTQGGIWAHDVIFPKLETVRELRRHPDLAPTLLVTLAPKQRPAVDHFDPTRMVSDLLHAAVIPEIFARHIAPPVAAPQIINDAAVLRLAELLLASDADAAVSMIHEAYTSQDSLLGLFKSLLEPAARRLGDFSVEQICSDYDVTIGLCHLQTAIRLLGSEMMSPLCAGTATPAVLVVPAPGELHSIGAALNSEAMWQQGWAPHSEFPANDRELQQILKDGWFDVLDLSLSTSLEREHWLPRMATTIDLARRASQNPDLIVIADGRSFFQSDEAAALVGADAGNNSATDITRDILNVMPKK